MDSTINNNITQPKPQVISDNKEEKRLNTQPDRKAKRPYVGVVRLPYISRTPISDTISLKEKQNPYTKYKITINKKNSDVRFDNILSISIIGCAFLSFLKLFKK